MNVRRAKAIGKSVFKVPYYVETTYNTVVSAADPLLGVNLFSVFRSAHCHTLDLLNARFPLVKNVVSCFYTEITFFQENFINKNRAETLAYQDNFSEQKYLGIE